MKNRKLRIAIFHLAFIYSGGGEKLVLQEYDGLTKRGHDVDIFTTVLDSKKSFPEIIKKYKIKTFLPNLKIFKNHEAFQTVLSCILVPFYASRFKKYDVILACNQPSPWIAMIVNLFFRVPYISYLAQPTRFLHQRKIDRQTGLFFTKKASESISAKMMMTTFKNFSDWADRVSIRSSKEILVNGEYVKKIIERIYKVKTISCPSGVVLTRNINFKKDKYLLVTNRHFPQKRIEYAIFVLNSLLQIKPNYRLKITGLNTDYTHSLIDLVNELGISEKVDFLGYVSEKHLASLYKKAACYLYTAPEEDFGMGVIEAMSFATPVVAWNSSGPSKIITDGFNGHLAKPSDLNDYTSKVIKIIGDKKHARTLSLNAIKSVANLYGFNNHIDIIENILKKVVV